jgi:hypothetical protein
MALPFLIIASGCGGSSKSERVEVSNPPQQEADLGQPYARIHLYLAADIASDFLQMFRAELDDGRYCYVLTGEDFAMDMNVDGWQSHDSPSLNTPDSGMMMLRFSLVDSVGTVLISDTASIDLRSDWHWHPGIGYHSYSPCNELNGAFGCRPYELPERLRSEQPMASKLWFCWSGNNLANSIDY